MNEKNRIATEYYYKHRLQIPCRIWINGVEIYLPSPPPPPLPRSTLKTSSRAQKGIRQDFIVTRSAAFHAFSRAALSLVMAAVSRSRVSLRLCTSWTEALMAIVSRSCRLAGFSTSSSPFPSFLFLASSLIFARTFHPVLSSLSLPTPSRVSFLGTGASSPLATRPKARRVFLFQVLTGRYLEENSLFLARDRRNSSVYIYIYLDCRCKRRGSRERGWRIRGNEV